MKVKISVTAEDIKLGVRCSILSCPIARAVKRKHPGFKTNKDLFVCVGKFEFTCYKEAKQKCFKLSKTAQTFINRFDSNQNVKPFSFIANIDKTS